VVPTDQPRTVVVLEHNGHGAMSRIGADATAFGYRNWSYNFLVTSIWTDPADTEANIRWTREFCDAMQPFLADAVYVNYLRDKVDRPFGASSLETVRGAGYRLRKDG